MPNEDQALTDISAPAAKPLTELMAELQALEDNAHNLADAQGAIRAKEREIIKAFAAAHDELRELFTSVNIEPIVEKVKAQIAKDNAQAIENIDAHIGEVVEQAKKNLDEAKVDVAAAVGDVNAKLADFNTTLGELQERVASIEDHPALSMPPIDAPAPAGTPAAEKKPAEDTASTQT